MRSRRSAWRWLVAKEWRELLASRAFWLLMALIGPLVGVSFINAVRVYSEASHAGGTGSGVGEAFSPLTGIFAPTFGAYEIAALFLFPFVVIRIVGGDRQSGALKLLLQQPTVSTVDLVGAKAAVLVAAWGLASIAGLVAVMLWAGYGGRVYWPELFSVWLGHLLNAALAVGLAAAAAAIAEHPSSAAMLALGFTIGTWVLAFVAAVQGGIWARVAAYTPTSVLQAFQQGLVSAGLVLVALVAALAGVGLAAIWLRIGVPLRRRIAASVALAGATVVLAAGAAQVNAHWDASEGRMNSFPEPVEEALGRLDAPLAIEVHLAPEDPRRYDLERQALSKLRRVMPRVRITYVSATSIGLFEQAQRGYGEIWYDLGGRREMSRLTTGEGVLETIFALAGTTPPAEDSEAIFRGHPLVAEPKWAAAIFYGVWPAAVAGAALAVRRKRR